ncbi:uncharacterized protein [Prorops nasuta]|uniref:uncharacterized protein n=1 Tax=Prorops nasuta TaxID=863751 RepID=UPI0034CD5B5E
MDESLRNPVLSPIQETEESVSSVTTGVSLIPKEGEENKATEMDASKATIDSSTETAGPIEPDTASVPAASCKVESTTGIGPEVSDPVESVTSVASAIIATLDQTAAIIAATSAHAESVAANVSPISVTEESAAATDKSTSNSTSLKSPDSSSDSPSEPAGGPVEPRIKIVTGAVESPIELATVEPVVTIITPSVVHYQAKSSPIETVRPLHLKGQISNLHLNQLYALGHQVHQHRPNDN